MLSVNDDTVPIPVMTHYLVSMALLLLAFAYQRLCTYILVTPQIMKLTIRRGDCDGHFKTFCSQQNKLIFHFSLWFQFTPSPGSNHLEGEKCVISILA